MNTEWTPLTRGRIVAAATALIDRGGLGALTTEALGDELGVTGMALYNHYPSKGALLDGVLEALLASVPPPPAEGSWEERLGAFYEGLWALLRAHPNALPLICTRPLTSPALRACAAPPQALLTAAGFAPEQARAALLTLTAYATGLAGLSAGGYLDATAALGVEGAAAAGRPAEVAGPDAVDWAAADRQFAAGFAVLLAGVRAQLGQGD